MRKVWVSLCVAWLSFATFLNGRVSKCCTQNFMWRATFRVCGRDVPNGLKKEQLEELVETDERDSRKKRIDKRDKRGELEGLCRAVAATCVMLKCGPFGKQLAELQRKTSMKSHEPPANADSSSPSDNEHSEYTATIAEMAKMLADLDSKMGPSYPASILLCTQLEEAKQERDGAKPAGEDPGRGKAAQKRDRKLWRPQLRSKTSCSTHFKRTKKICT